MAKPKRYRWTCPRCESGVLASSAPRRNAIVRYCLPCSEDAGSLVERTCPALDAQRRAKEQQRLAKAKRKRTSAATRRAANKRQSGRRAAKVKAAREEVAGDLHEELKRIWPIALKYSPRDDVPEAVPELGLYTRTGSHTSGYASWDDDHRMHVSVGVNDDVAGAYGTLAHEAAHLVQNRDGVHDRGFWVILIDIVHEAYGAVVYIDQLDDESTKYLKQCAIEEAIRKARGYG